MTVCPDDRVLLEKQLPQNVFCHVSGTPTWAEFGDNNPITPCMLEDETQDTNASNCNYKHPSHRDQVVFFDDHIVVPEMSPP